ncbi:MAG: DUF11 domain-containing protein [Anaerolineae bacterium]|nr:DUF11 domain-containing protein [Anaerolineae bacterium]
MRLRRTISWRIGLVMGLAILSFMLAAVGAATLADVIYDTYVYLPMVQRGRLPVDVAVAKASFPNPYVAGSPITYTITLTNLGPDPATAITATEALPVQILSVTYTTTVGTYDAAAGLWEGLDLAAGEVATLTIVGTVDAAFTGTLQNTVVVTPAAALDPDLTNNRAWNYNPALSIEDRLLNPGFEGINYGGEHWHRTHYGDYAAMPVPIEWTAWWTVDPIQELGQPEIVRIIPNSGPYIGPPARIRSGDWAVMMYRWGKYQGGFYQRVADLPAGAQASFSIYAHSWTCNDPNHQPPGYSCGDPYAATFTVGIDPHGGLDPWSADIVWSDDVYLQDVYGQVGPVETFIGAEGAVTVFARFDSLKWGTSNNDAYWDDAALVIQP